MVTGQFLHVCDRGGKRKTEKGNSPCCPQQHSSLSSALVGDDGACGRSASKIINTWHAHTHRHTKGIQYSILDRIKNSPGLFSAITGFLFQHLVATEQFSLECCAAKTKQRNSIPFTSSTSIISYHFIILFFRNIFPLSSWLARISYHKWRMNDLIGKLHVNHILGETPIVLMLGSAAKGICSHFWPQT